MTHCALGFLLVDEALNSQFCNIQQISALFVSKIFGSQDSSIINSACLPDLTDTVAPTKLRIATQSVILRVHVDSQPYQGDPTTLNSITLFYVIVRRSGPHATTRSLEKSLLKRQVLHITSKSLETEILRIAKYWKEDSAHGVCSSKSRYL